MKSDTSALPGQSSLFIHWDVNSKFISYLLEESSDLFYAGLWHLLKLYWLNWYRRMTSQISLFQLQILHLKEKR